MVLIYEHIKRYSLIKVSFPLYNSQIYVSLLFFPSFSIYPILCFSEVLEMGSAEMSRGKTSDVPTPFRGLRVLLVDNDTSSLLNIASELEDYSYRGRFTNYCSVLRAASLLMAKTCTSNS